MSEQKEERKNFVPSSNRIVLIASALEEELGDVLLFFKNTFPLDMYATSHLQKMIGDSIKVFCGGDDTSYILYNTSFGFDAAYIAMKKISSICHIDEVNYVGCCLGISQHLKKYDLLEVDSVYSIHEDKNWRLATLGANNKKLGQSYPRATVISSSEFVNIKKQRSQGLRGEEMLIPLTRDCIVRVRQDKGEEQYIVYDMESVPVCKGIFEHRNDGAIYEKEPDNDIVHSDIHIIRVVLDTLYDTENINFREEIRQISKIIRAYIENFIVRK